ncbi:MAG: hypothetical protein GY811_17390 [Myxococcales bacterium]|nr:hypothetical protein [Myxococcales bacterium]
MRELLKKVYGNTSECIDPRQLELALEGMRADQAAEEPPEDPNADVPDCEVSSEILEYAPIQFKVIVYVRETWANDAGDIVTAPRIWQNHREGARLPWSTHACGLGQVQRPHAAQSKGRDI